VIPEPRRGGHRERDVLFEEVALPHQGPGGRAHAVEIRRARGVALGDGRARIAGGLALHFADLRRRGFSIPQLHAIIRALKEQFGVRLFDATGGGGSLQLLTDGREIYARTSLGKFFNLLQSPGQAMLVVGNEGLLKELSGKVRTKKKKKTA